MINTVYAKFICDTGRTHQIRVHFQHIGHPIVGDSLYDGFHDKIHGQVLQCNANIFCSSNQ